MGVKKCVGMLPTVWRECEYGCFMQPATERPGYGALLNSGSWSCRIVGS